MERSSSSSTGQKNGSRGLLCSTLAAGRVKVTWMLPKGHGLVPLSPDNNLIKNEVVLSPSEPRIYESEEHLVAEIAAFIHRYADLSSTFEQLESDSIGLNRKGIPKSGGL